MRIPGIFFRDKAPDPQPRAEARPEPAPEPVPAPAETNVLSLVHASIQEIGRAENDRDALRILLAAAADLGAERPMGGLWQAGADAYEMWRHDVATRCATPCGTAPAAVYATAPALEDASHTGAPAVRLNDRRGPWGVLDVTGQISNPSALAALTTLARGVMLRLDTAEADAGANPGERLLEITEPWWDAPDTEALLRRVLADVTRLCHADSCAVTLLEPGSGTARIAYGEDLDGSEGPLPWMPLDNDRRNGDAIRRVISTGTPLAFHWNPVTEALKEGLLPTGPGEGSYLAWPLVEAGRVIGVLDVQSHAPRHFPPPREAALAHAARSLSRILSLRDAALFQSQSGRRKDLLLTTVGDLSAETDPKTIAEVLTRAAWKMWPRAAIVYAMLPQAEGGVWAIAALESRRPEDKRQGWARAGEGFAGWVIQSRQPLAISAAADDPRRGALDRGLAISAGMWAPMQRANTMLGLLAVVSQEGDPCYTPDDLEALEALAGQGAVALERARERHGTQAAFWDAIEAIAGAIDARDGYTHGHSRNVTEYALAIGRRMGLPPEEERALRGAALLHDIGKIGIPDHILNKPGALTPDERAVMESHSEIGYEILLRAPSLQALLPGVRFHHERMDGRGYPSGLSGDRLPMQARIIAVADTFDALTSDRVYRKRMTVEKAADILREGRGTQWDAGCVDIFLQILEERGTVRIQMMVAEDSGRQYLPSLGPDVFGPG